VEKLAQALNEWRTRTEELLVYLDLAALNVRDAVRKRLEVTENVYLAARSQLATARQDDEANFKSTREGVEQLITDLRRACDAMEAVVRRANQQ
jgi:hypothetical protein